MTGLSLRVHVLGVALATSLAMAMSLHAPYAHGQPLFQGSLACPGGVPTGEQVGHGLLGALVDPTLGNPLNSAWTGDSVQKKIEGDTYILNRQHVPNGCNSDVDRVCGFEGSSGSATCSFVYVDMTIKPSSSTSLDALRGLGQLRFTNLDVYREGVNQRNVAAHTNRGPDASVITDGVFGPDSSDAADPAYAIVLPHNGANGAIVIDLGTTYPVCGVQSGCPAPLIQADNDDIYQLDYFNATTNGWIEVGQFPHPSGSGLATRSLTSSKVGSSFTARYVRVYGVDGGSNWSVSELQLWDTSKNLISVGKPAVGPLPYQIMDGKVAPSEQWDAADANYSVVLPHKTGSATALMVDLGRVVQICGNKYVCGHEPTIQADNDDEYMFDYSIDGKDWTTYGHVDANDAWHGTFQAISGKGLMTRDLKCTARPDPSTACSKDNEGPNFSARYVRVYARDGGNTFAVSELQLWDTGGNLVLPLSPPLAPGQPPSRPAYGPEPFFINGEFAPEGTGGTDTHWVTKLGDCTKNTKSKCPVATVGTAKSAFKQIDLTAVFPISGITIQADNNDTYQVDGSIDGLTWRSLWTVPTVSSSGLRTRRLTIPPPLPTAQYVRVYATAGDGSYSVSELEVFTPQANTAGTYATAEDNQDFVWFDGRANDGQNFVCAYDGPFTTGLGVYNGTAVLPFATLPIQFYVDSVSLNTHCTDGSDVNIAAAHQRQCSMTLVPPLSYAPPFTDRFQAGYCAPTTAKPQGYGILSYVNFDDSGTSGSNSIVQFASKDNVSPDGTGPAECHGSDLCCSNWSNLDAHIPDTLRGVVPPLVAAVTRHVLNQILDYHPNPDPTVQTLIPFPRDTSQPQPYPPLRCEGAQIVGDPPPPAPDNINGLSGRATHVGGGDHATLRIAGRFTAETAIALDEAVLTVHSLLHELGVGDVAQGLPLSLQPSNGSKPDKGHYHTPPGASPIVKARVEPTKGARNGSMDFEIDVKRATIPEPARCLEGAATAPLTMSFLLVGGSEEPVWVHARANWQCHGDQLLTP